MSSVLQLLLEGERLDTAQMAQVLGLSDVPRAGDTFVEEEHPARPKGAALRRRQGGA